ncbi:anthranilate synthase component II [Thalassotalea marina]|uniref:Glutamine amidotransferase n=1 Tax=Thalassotalea marina TaxID=1673741 RepID=A0A919BRK3_9GAMM|nr:aminodeoxychorismate/anthranilate synthase component II [Thalassotalea marina]GHG05566.1 glutamine amidotransferase [Thalassotalea marina]
MLLMIDNYDSFTFNLVHYFEALGQSVKVCRNDEITLQDITAMAPKYIVISPGPCTPNEAGISLAVIEHFAGKVPILGVCLGHQSIAQVYGANVIKAKQVMHGKTSLVKHLNKSVFQDLNQPLTVTRYHSLVVEKSSIPDELEIIAWTENNQGDFDEIMGLQHKALPIVSVQFHPESVMTEQGHQLLNNFISQYCDYNRQ